MAVHDMLDDDRSLHDAITSLDRSRAVLRDAIETVPGERRQERPSASAWSVAEVLEHLDLVERGISRLLQRSAAKVRPDAERVPSRLKLDLLTDRGVRIESVAAALPTGRLTQVQAWRALQQSRLDLLHIIQSVEPRVWASVSAPHFALGLLSGVDWIRFVGGHEERHAAQIREAARTFAQEPHRRLDPRPEP